MRTDLAAVPTARRSDEHEHPFPEKIVLLWHDEPDSGGGEVWATVQYLLGFAAWASTYYVSWHGANAVHADGTRGRRQFGQGGRVY